MAVRFELWPYSGSLSTGRGGNCQRRGASARKEQILAFVDAIGVANGRIGCSEAGPGGRAAQVGLCEIPESVALAHFDREGGAIRVNDRRYGTCNDSRKIELGASADLVGIDDARIDGEEFGIAIATAKGFLRQLPEGIAGLHGDNILCGDRG